jgi:hypothetical protein
VLSAAIYNLRVMMLRTRALKRTIHMLEVCIDVLKFHFLFQKVSILTRFRLEDEMRVHPDTLNCLGGGLREFKS